MGNLKKNTTKSVRKIPMRQCVGCGEMKSKKEMMRVVKTSGTDPKTEAGAEEYVIDTTGKKNGRGAYLCFSKECFQKAVKSKGLERSFKHAIPKEVYEKLEKELDSLEIK